MCTEKHDLVKDMFTNRKKLVCHNEPESRRQSMGQKLSCKKKVPDAAARKESRIENFLERERNHHVNFLEKVTTVNTASNFQIIKQNSI